MDEPLVSVGALHALVYCERLFYLEEVERIRTADAAVYAGRRLHAELEREEGDVAERHTLSSERLGITGKMDVLRRRDGVLIPHEHKRGRSAGTKGNREAWQTDRVQIGAYALLVEEAFGVTIREGRVRYHSDAVTIRVPIDEALRRDVFAAIERAKTLREQVERPPLTDNERLCVRCSLQSVCLPEELRTAPEGEERPVRVLPEHRDGMVLHVVSQGARVGRRGEQISVENRDGSTERWPIAQLSSVVVHGMAQISTQTLRLCTDHDVGVHWMTQSGGHVASLLPPATGAQRHLRQFEALRDPGFCLELAKKTVRAKLETQLRYLLRSSRGAQRSASLERALFGIRSAMRQAVGALSAQELLGSEGAGAAAYFSSLDELLSEQLDPRLRFSGRNRRPPADRFNACLSFGYGSLYRYVVGAIVGVGIHPGVGFYHRPRSSAQTLALDLMEPFRVPLVDMAVVAAFNRRTFDADEDFIDTAGQVLMTESGRSKLIEVLERRMMDEWRHEVVGVSMSYARILEVEARLLEKEWTGEPGRYARLRIR